MDVAALVARQERVAERNEASALRQENAAARIEAAEAAQRKTALLQVQLVDRLDRVVKRSEAVGHALSGTTSELRIAIADADRVVAGQKLTEVIKRG